MRIKAYAEMDESTLLPKYTTANGHRVQGKPPPDSVVQTGRQQQALIVRISNRRVKENRYKILAPEAVTRG